MSNDSSRRFWRKLAVQFLLGAVAGAAAVLLVGPWIKEADFGDVHEFGLLIGALLLYFGLSLLVAAASPTRAAKLMGATPEPGEDYTAEARSVRLQALVTGFAGVELIVLSWRTDLLTGPAGPVLAASLLALILLQTWLNYLIWRRGDEFFRRVLVESAVISFVAFQFLLCAWALGARFGFIDDPAVLDVYVTMMALYLVAGFVAGVRRGLGVPES